MRKLFSLFMIITLGYVAILLNSAQAFHVDFFKTKDNLSLRKMILPAKGKSRGTIIFMEGMGGFIEGYTGIMSAMSRDGFDVLAFDSRGQGASQRITQKHSLLHIESFDDYVEDLHMFINHQKKIQKGKLQRPLIFLGISMGGHVALRYAHDYPDVPDALVLLSPMVDINTGAYPRPFARTIATVMSSLGAGENFVLGYDTFTLQSCLEKYDSSKHGDYDKHLQDCKMFHERPHLAIGGPSFSWLSSAFESCDKLMEPGYTDALKMPVLLLSVENDHLVETDAQIHLCKKLSNCRQFVFKDANHNLLKEKDHVIEEIYGNIKKFAEELPKKPGAIIKKDTPITQLVMDKN